jgi:hypothetical protein
MHARTVIAWLLPLGLFAVVSGAGPQDEEHETSVLEDHMETIEGAVKVLRRSLRDPANRADSLELVAEIQAATVVCKSLVPPMAETVPEAERAAFVTEYRLMLVDFLGHQLALERALLADDAEAVQAAFKLVRDMEDTGHERFTEDE